MRTNRDRSRTTKCGSHKFHLCTKVVRLSSTGVLKGWFHILPKSLFVRGTKSLYLRAVIPKLMEILQAPCDRALRLSPKCKDPLVYHFISLNRVARSADAFDIIHFHTDYLHFPLFAQRWRKTLTTMHGRLDPPDLPPVLREFAMMPRVSISTAQRAP